MPISFVPYTAVYGPLSLAGVTCTLWLDGADTTTFVKSGSSIAQWSDKSKSANHCIQATLANAPTVGSAPNGLTSVLFASSTTQLVSLNNIPYTGASVRTVIYVFYLPVTGNKIVTTFGAATANNCYDVSIAAVAGDNIYYPSLYNNDILLNTFTYSSILVGTPCIVYTYYDGASMGGWINSANNQTRSTTPATTSTPLYLGARTDGYSSLNGHIFEAIHFNSILTTPQRQAIEGYLAQKWGLTANLPPGHPGLTQTLYNGKVYQPQISLKSAPYANYYPLSIASCALWLDGADPAGTGIAPANNSAVATWIDKSGNGCNAVATSGTATFQTNIQNSLGSLLFSTQRYSVTYNSFPNSAYTFIIVMYSTTANGYFISGPTDGFIYIGPRGGYFGTFTGNGTWNDTNTNTPNITTTNTWVIGDMVISGSLLSPFVNGTSQNTKTGTTGAINSFAIGVHGTLNSEYFTGYAAEILLFNTALTTNQRQSIEGYLAWKWGITLVNTQPYYSAPPLEYTRGSILPPPTLNAFGRLPYASQTPYYNVSQQTWLSVWQPYLQELVAANSGATASLSSTGASVTSTNTGAAIIAPNGNIYYSVVGSSISYYNPTTNAVNSIALGQAIDSPSAVLGADGNMYMYPTNANTGQNIIKITTSNNTASTISAGTNGWWGMILAPNGNIYGIPARTMTNVLVLNTTTGTTSTITGTTNGYWGGVLAPNGKIYCIPGPSVAIIDPVAGTITPNAVSGGGQANGYFGGVLGWDGNIYCIPCSGTGAGNAVGIINPTTNTFTTISSTAAFYSGGCLGPDGKIYCIPRSGGAIGVINIATQSFSVSSMSLPTGSTYNGATLAPSGIIYVSPYTSGSVIYKITFSGLSLSPYLNLCLTPYINKF